MTPNRAMLERVARRLEPLLPELVFLGGSVVELLLTDPGAGRVRRTDDVDVVCEVASRTAYHRLTNRLRDLGFAVDSRPGAPICRFRSESDVLDVMPLEERLLGFGNPWYGEALASAEWYPLAPDLRIRLVTAPVFLATKWSAFDGRGGGDYYASHDVEDIIALVALR